MLLQDWKKLRVEDTGVHPVVGNFRLADRVYEAGEFAWPIFFTELSVKFLSEWVSTNISLPSYKRYLGEETLTS
jgi:hypothetical protein